MNKLRILHHVLNNRSYNNESFTCLYEIDDWGYYDLTLHLQEGDILIVLDSIYFVSNVLSSIIETYVLTLKKKQSKPFITSGTSCEVTVRYANYGDPFDEGVTIEVDDISVYVSYEEVELLIDKLFKQISKEELAEMSLSFALEKYKKELKVND